MIRCYLFALAASFTMTNSAFPAEIAFVWAHNPTAAQYAPSGAYAKNAGQPIVVRRSSVGRYSVEFGRVAETGANVQVSNYGRQRGHCNVTAWGGGTARVACFDGSHRPADRRFTLLAVRGESGDQDRLAYAWANDASAASYEASMHYRFGDASFEASRSATGAYTVALGDVAGTGAAVLATAYGSAHDCGVRRWSQGQVHFRCVGTDSTGMDSRATILAISDTFPGASYLWNSRPEGEIGMAYSRASDGSAQSIGRVGTGEYRIAIGPEAAAGGHLQISAYGSNATCWIGGWGGGAASVLCARGDIPTDSRFVAVALGDAASQRPPPVVVGGEADDDGGFVFVGDDGLQGERVESVGADQVVLIVPVEPKWLNTGRSFADVSAQITSDAQTMSDFWEENAFGAISFEHRILGTSIIPLSKSYQYYYHEATQRQLLGRRLPAMTAFPGDKNIVIENDGQDVEVTFEAGSYTRDQLRQQIEGAIEDADPAMAPPTLTVALTGAGLGQLSLNTTRDRALRSKIELTGDAIAELGFGSSGLYNLGEDAPASLLFGMPVAKEGIAFPNDAALTVATQGSATTVATFAAGETLDLSDIVARIEGARPSADDQQPFSVAMRDDPLDGNKAFLTFATVVDDGEDDGFALTVTGNAASRLGFAAAGGTANGRISRYEPEISHGYEAVLEGMNSYAANLPAGTSIEEEFGDARIFVGSVVDPADNYRAFAGGYSFNILGEVFDVNFFTDSWLGSWQVFAHETGHAIGFPDLYRVSDEMIGTPPGRWDIMDCSWCDAHSTSYLKSFAHHPEETRPTGWIPSASTMKIDPPSGALSRTDRFILTPVESQWISSSANPFAASHPRVPVVHAVRFVPSDESDVMIAENRQTGVYQADHLGDPVDFSTSLPSEGVILYQARRQQPSSVTSFLPVNMLTPIDNPLDTLNESFRHTISLSNGLELRILEVLTNPDISGSAPSFSYLVEATWGEGSFFDVAIRDWTPPPWESPDMWIDNRAENDWGVYTYASDEDGTEPVLNGDNVAVGQVNRVYARVRNAGDLPITSDLELVFKIVVPLRVGEAEESALETEIGRTVISGGLDGRFGANPERTAFIEWPVRDTNQEHVCIRVYITPVPNELNATANNSAQENLTQWFSTTSSPFTPVSFEVVTENPFKERTSQIRLQVPDVPLGWTVAVEDVEFVLDPGETRTQTVTVLPIYDDLLSSIREIGYAEPFSAAIEAITPIGDNWTVFGGITAVVHPVNADSSLTVVPVGEPGATVIGGRLSTTGPMTPPVSDRAVNIRYRTQDGREVWTRTRTDSGGSYFAEPPQEIRSHPYVVTAFHGGGQGIRPTRSADLAVRPRPIVIDPDPGNGGILRPRR